MNEYLEMAEALKQKYGFIDDRGIWLLSSPSHSFIPRAITLLLRAAKAEREASTPSARSDIPQDPVFISELSAAGEKSGAVDGEGA